jgi:hypothetical protein
MQTLLLPTSASAQVAMVKLTYASLVPSYANRAAQLQPLQHMLQRVYAKGYWKNTASKAALGIAQIEAATANGPLLPQLQLQYADTDYIDNDPSAAVSFDDLTPEEQAKLVEAEEAEEASEATAPDISCLPTATCAWEDSDFATFSARVLHQLAPANGGWWLLLSGGIAGKQLGFDPRLGAYVVFNPKLIPASLRAQLADYTTLLLPLPLQTTAKPLTYLRNWTASQREQEAWTITEAEASNLLRRCYPRTQLSSEAIASELASLRASEEWRRMPTTATGQQDRYFRYNAAQDTWLRWRPKTQIELARELTRIEHKSMQAISLDF